MAKKTTKKSSKTKTKKTRSKKLTLEEKPKEEEKRLLVNIINDLLDKNTSDTVNILYGKKNVNEFLIAKKLNLTINQIRNILYKLSDLSLVSFTRKKDKRKGWYTYFWTLNTEKAFIFLENILKKRLEELKNQLKSREVKRFYHCKICKTEVSEETALLNDFTCRECGEVYEITDNEKPIKEIKNKITRIEKDYGIVEQEITKIKEKEAKRSAREIKKLNKRKSRKITRKTKKKTTNTKSKTKKKKKTSKTKNKTKKKPRKTKKTSKSKTKKRSKKK